MRHCEPFQPEDLRDLDERLLSRAWAVVPLREVHAGNTNPAVIALRHDVDDRGWPAAVALARWEAERGYRSTFFLLHTAPYWTDEDDSEFRAGLEEIALLGHEIGIHVNGIAEALRTGGDPHVILAGAVGLLRSWGHSIRGMAAHGDSLCYKHQPASLQTAQVGFVNDEQFTECARPNVGPATRPLELGDYRMRLAPVPLETFGLDYSASHLKRAVYVSDAGGSWNEPFDQVVERFPPSLGQLHMLLHPDWWHDALTSQPLAA